MKHILLFILSLLPMLASAEAVEINGIWYNLISKGKIAEVTSNPNPNGKYKGAVEIPESVLFEGVTYSVTSIGNQAFMSSVNMTSVVIPNCVTSIGERAFHSCSGLSSVVIPNSVTSIGKSAFCACYGLTSISISNNVTAIGNYVFSNCTALTSITIPNSVTSIGQYAFEKCSSLSFISIPNSVTSIGDYAFQYCSVLTSISIPNSVTDIGIGAFLFCDHLASVVIPESVTKIKGNTFYGCSGLASIVIPNSVEFIGASAFYNCSSLTSINIPNGIKNIYITTFYGCSSLISITIPNSVTDIGERAFHSCSSLTSITIPNSVTSIGYSCFWGCKGLVSLTIPNSVVHIEEGTFKKCSGLKTVTIGQSVRTIDKEAFCDCPELMDVYCLAENVPTTNADAFKDSYIEYATLHVPASSLEQYKATAPWSDFGSKVPIDGDEPNPEPKKCATPTISYVDGELVFNSETEDAVFVSEITDADIKKHYSKSVSLTATYNICVFATKEGFENSDTIQATLCWIDAEPISEGLTDEDAVAEVKALPVLINSQGGIVTIQGAPEGTPIAIYGTDGKDYGSAVAAKDRTTIATSLHRGSVAIIMIGEKAVKVAIR